MKKFFEDIFANTSLLKRVFWLLGIVLTLIGTIGWIDRFWHGHLNANYGNIVTWGLWIAFYIYFIGLSAGAFLISSLVYAFNFKQFERIGRLALFTAIVTLILALFSVVADIGHMFRSWHILAYPNFKSPMAWMIWLYSFYFVLVSAELWFLLRQDFILGKTIPGWKGMFYRILSLGSDDRSEQRKKRDLAIVRTLAIIGIPLAIMFHGGVGALFGIIAARPHWHSGMFPILFLLSALVSGGAFLIMIAAVFQQGIERNRDTIIALGKLVLFLFLLDVLFQVSEVLIAFRGGIPGHTAGMGLSMFGPYWWVFWGWQIAVGTLIPLYLLIAPHLRNNPVTVAMAGFLIAAGFAGMRLNIVIPGLATEEIEGIASSIASLRYTANYFPSISEFLLITGVVGLGFLLFGLGEMLLPTVLDPTKDEVKHVRV